jgi:ABC-2 type transport system permease protein
MPIHDLGYRHWSGPWTSHPYRWWVITRHGLSMLARKKRFVFLMILSSLPVVVRSVMIYLSTVIGKSAPVLRVDGKFFEDFLSQQAFFVFLITIYAGAGSISNDLRANALQIYLSKPITRGDYIMGKLGTLVIILAMPTLVPGFLLFLFAVLVESNLAFLGQYYWVPISMLAYSTAMILTYALVMLALSSMTRSSRFAGINFAAVFFFSQILYGILSGILRTTRVAWISLGNNLTQVGDSLFRNNPKYACPVWISGLILAILVAGSAWLIHRHVKAVEVVS